MIIQGCQSYDWQPFDVCNEGGNMFADQAKIYIRSGKGGAGHVSFRRELYVPAGVRTAEMAAGAAT